MFKRNLAIVAIALSFLAAASGFAADFKIDNVHSSVIFSVKHMGVGIAYGRFNKFEGDISYDPSNPTAASFNVTIHTDSVDSGNERRDGHLKNADFFNAVEFPQATFKSTKIEQGEGKTLKVTGDLTILGETRSYTFHMTDLGQVEMRGKMMQAWHGEGVIKRSDFKMNYGIDNGALSDEVKLIFSLETKGA